MNAGRGMAEDSFEGNTASDIERHTTEHLFIDQTHWGILITIVLGWRVITSPLNHLWHCVAHHLQLVLQVREVQLSGLATHTSKVCPPNDTLLFLII